jgi:hypothetical protein
MWHIILTIALRLRQHQFLMGSNGSRFPMEQGLFFRKCEDGTIIRNGLSSF